MYKVSPSNLALKSPPEIPPGPSLLKRGVMG